MKGLAEKERERKKIPPLQHHLLLVLSVEDWAQTQNIDLPKKKKLVRTNTHFIIIQDKQKLKKTQEFSEQVRLVKLFPFLPVTYLFTLHGVPDTHTYSTLFTPTTHHHISLHCHHQIRNTIGVSVASPSHYNFPYDAHDSDIFIECRNIH